MLKFYDWFDNVFVWLVDISYFMSNIKCEKHSTSVFKVLTWFVSPCSALKPGIKICILSQGVWLLFGHAWGRTLSGSMHIYWGSLLWRALHAQLTQICEYITAPSEITTKIATLDIVQAGRTSYLPTDGVKALKAFNCPQATRYYSRPVGQLHIMCTSHQHRLDVRVLVLSMITRPDE